MRNSHLVVSVLLIFIAIGTLAYIRSESAKYVIELNNLSYDSIYSIDGGAAYEFSILEKGRIGSMLSCLKSYRDISGRRVRGEDSRVMIMYVDGIYVLNTSVSGGEIYSFTLEKRPPNSEKGWVTPVFAVNCDLKLLNN
ncbi:hypothetical protein [Enterovibrio norvegicus]|uniref:Uncharacterized protein n=1 Tax=Enterovibrio norvegicus TaxID=188144 RepID=A0A2N7LHD5_9GAMM|nr:hypothetical protein [Enterovibrio norvegicus]PMN94895.1 hypothetical protein BCT23_02360 [Enterovibrio norvegicus]